MGKVLESINNERKLNHEFESEKNYKKDKKFDQFMEARKERNKREAQLHRELQEQL